jgi:hypothetical protein
MRSTRDKLMNEKRLDTLKQIKRKNEISQKLIDKSKNDKMNRLTKMNSTLQADELIRKKMKNHLDKLEEERLEIERLIETRSNKTKIKF